jgi:hypothetical protein
MSKVHNEAWAGVIEVQNHMMSLLHGELLCEWLYFDKPQHAFESADRSNIHCLLMEKKLKDLNAPIKQN